MICVSTRPFAMVPSSPACSLLGVETFAGTVGSLLDDPQLWKRVSNDAFFAAIRRAWDFYDAPHMS